MIGSVPTDRLDPERSDVDVLVDVIPENENLFDDLFDLQAELKRIVGRGVDLIDASAVRKPYVRASACGHAQDLVSA